MAESLSVDPTALVEAAGRLDSLVQAIQSSALGGEAVAGLLSLDGHLPGTQTGAGAAELGRALAELTGQVEAAVQGLGTGLRVAAETYHRVDVVSGQAAISLAEQAP